MQTICTDKSNLCIDSEDPAVFYGGSGWSNAENLKFYFNTSQGTATVRDSVTLAFGGEYYFVWSYYHAQKSGPFVEIYGWWRGGFSMANLTFFLDNQPVGVYENSTPTLNVASFLLYNSTPFSDDHEAHTITAINFGSFLAIDGFVFQNPSLQVVQASKGTVQSTTATSSIPTLDPNTALTSTASTTATLSPFPPKWVHHIVRCLYLLNILCWYV